MEVRICVGTTYGPGQQRASLAAIRGLLVAIGHSILGFTPRRPRNTAENADPGRFLGGPGDGGFGTALVLTGHERRGSRDISAVEGVSTEPSVLQHLASGCSVGGAAEASRSAWSEVPGGPVRPGCDSVGGTAAHPHRDGRPGDAHGPRWRSETRGPSARSTSSSHRARPPDRSAQTGSGEPPREPARPERSTSGRRVRRPGSSSRARVDARDPPPRGATSLRGSMARRLTSRQPRLFPPLSLSFHWSEKHERSTARRQDHRPA